MLTIDYTQTKAYLKCPLYWYEKYVRGYTRKWTGQRDDALTFGSLVHDCHHQWRERGLPTPLQETLDDLDPTPDCLQEALRLIQGYVRTYPTEEWELEKCEEAVRFPVIEGLVEGVAKLDSYFFNPKHTVIESGVEGYTLTLEPGWWGKELKTKASERNRANWMKAWEVGLQASFQTLALREKLGEQPQGILVSVLEKPKRYTPKRKCKGCGELLEMSVYLPTKDGLHACPLCGNAQKLSPYEPKSLPEPGYFRMKVPRTAAELERDFRTIQEVASNMDAIRTRHEAGQDLYDFNGWRNPESCVHEWFGPCEFYRTHTYLEPIDQNEELMKFEPLKYLGELL